LKSERRRQGFDYWFYIFDLDIALAFGQVLMASQGREVWH